MSYEAMFSYHFKLHRWDLSDHPRHYFSGLPGKTRRKNMERIEADEGRCMSSPEYNRFSGCG
jgi:hypothetical protein